MERDYKLFIVVGLLFIASIGLSVFVLASLAKTINNNPLRVTLFGEKKIEFIDKLSGRSAVVTIGTCLLSLGLLHLFW